MALFHSSCFLAILIIAIGGACACDMMELQSCLKLMKVGTSDQHAICRAMEEAKPCLGNLTDASCPGPIKEAATRVLGMIKEEQAKSPCKDFQGGNQNVTCPDDNSTTEVMDCMQLFHITMIYSEKTGCRMIPAVKTCLKPLADNCPRYLANVYTSLGFNPEEAMESKCARLGVDSNSTADASSNATADASSGNTLAANATSSSNSTVDASSSNSTATLGSSNSTASSGSGNKTCSLDCLDKMDSVTSTADPSDICSTINETQSCFEREVDQCQGPMLVVIGKVQKLLNGSDALCNHIDNNLQSNSTCSKSDMDSCMRQVTKLTDADSQEDKCSAIDNATLCLNAFSSKGCHKDIMMLLDDARTKLSINQSVCDKNSTGNMTGTSTSGPGTTMVSSTPDSVTTTAMMYGTTTSKPSKHHHSHRCTMRHYTKCVKGLEENLSKSDKQICKGFIRARACLNQLASKGCRGRAKKSVDIALKHLKGTDSYCQNVGIKDITTVPPTTTEYIPTTPFYIPRPRQTYPPTRRPFYVSRPRPEVTTPRSIGVTRPRSCTPENYSQCVSTIDENLSKADYEKCSGFFETRTCLTELSNSCQGTAKRNVDYFLARLERTERFCKRFESSSRPETPSRPRPAPRPYPRPDPRPVPRPAPRPDPRPVNPIYPRRDNTVDVQTCTSRAVDKCVRSMLSVNRRTHPRVICSTFDEAKSCLDALSRLGCRGEARAAMDTMRTRMRTTRPSVCSNLVTRVEPTSNIACTSESVYKCGPQSISTSFKANPCQFVSESLACLDRFASKCKGQLKSSVDQSMKQLTDMNESMCRGG